MHSFFSIYYSNASSYYRVGRIWFLILSTVGKHTICRRNGGIIRRPAGEGGALRAKGVVFRVGALVRPSVCSKRTFSCYFWRKSNQNVGVGCAIKDAKSRQHLPHKQFQKIPLAPAAVHTPPHPRFRSSLASSLLIETMFISTTHPNSCRERIRMAGLQSLLIPHMFLWRAHHTRMAKQKNLSILHAMLPVSLSEGKCSRKLCLPQRVAFMCRAQHLLRRAHSIARMAKFVSSARDTDSHFLRKHMLPHFLLAEPAFYP